MRLRILTRASDLARLQGEIVRRRLVAEWPRAEVSLDTRVSAGDLDRATPLWQMGDKGAFTADLSEALVAGTADIVVHSWKDLPIESRRGTIVVATLPREDARDVLLIRQDAAATRPPWLRILSSSPRRALMLGESLARLLPWAVETIETVPVRGNVPTRIRKLVDGEGDALVVAKAALDRLLDPASPFVEAAAAVRGALDRCHWMVLPLREFPAAAAQGALALEVPASNQTLREALAAISDVETWRAVTEERAMLAAHGGGCHLALGVTVRPMPFGDIVSVRGQAPDGTRLARWTLRREGAAQPRADVTRIYPRPAERGLVVRLRIDSHLPSDERGLYVTHPHALPREWAVGPDRVVWAAGPSTWHALASRGVWVHGSSEGLGHFDAAAVDRLTGRAMTWHRLTHREAAAADALPTYTAEHVLPGDLDTRTHFFWRSAAEFRKAVSTFPAIRDRWHACGPGRTLDAVSDAAGAARVRPVLGYQEWLDETTR